MLNTIYHRAQKPWIYQIDHNKVEVIIRVGKQTVSNIELIYGDTLGLHINGKWFNKTTNMKKLCETTNHEIWIGQMDHFTKRYRYAFNIKIMGDKEIIIGEIGKIPSRDVINEEGNGFTYTYWNKKNDLNVPNWFRQTNWYQIFPDRFSRKKNDAEKFGDWNRKPQSHEIFGGDIKGIVDKLDHIKSLGFSGLYLTPIFESPTAHRYDTTDYYSIDPVLGSEAELEELIKSAHKKGLKIMLDAVYNHIGWTSKPWQDVLKNKENSKYKDWFWINDYSKLKLANEYKNDEFTQNYPYETFGFVSEMPRLNWNNKEVTKYLLDSAKKWTNLGIDGWRLDVSWEPSYEFWRKFNKTVSKINKDIVIIGEVWWDSIDFLNGDMWHGVMNYPLRKVIFDYVNSSQSLKDKWRFIYRFNEISVSYTPQQQWGMFNLLSSHDTLRTITFFQNDKAKFIQAMKILFFNPGSTSTYYGEEFGLEGYGDPDNRRTINWDNQTHIFFSFFQNLLKERNKFVNTSSIYDRFVAKLYNENIILENSNNEIVLVNNEVIRREK